VIAALVRGERWRWLVAGLVLLFAALLPPLSGLYENANPDYSAKFGIFLGTEALVLALWAVSYNLMLGYTGMVSFAHAAYYGVGAYTVALLFKRYHLPVLEGLVLAPVAAAIFGFVTGLIALRAVRLYFSLLTLAISQLLFSIGFSWCEIGCDNGLHGLTSPQWLTDFTTLYYFVGGVAAVCLVLMFILVRSPFGAALAAIRENRERARSIGINVKAYELSVFTVAALFAGVAGGLFAVFQQEAFPEMLYWTNNASPVVVSLLGGTGTFLGPVIGAFVFTELQSWISGTLPGLVSSMVGVDIKNQVGQLFDLVLGAIVLTVVLIVPGGLSALPRAIIALRSRFRKSDQERAEETTGEAMDMADAGRIAAVQAVQAEETSVEKGAPLLVIEGLSKSFGGLRAVENVSLTVHAGDRHAIIGPNGAGKSTLFNLITGRIRPDAGRVLFDGGDITGKAPHVIARQGIGRAFQITMIFPKLTVMQNLQYSMLAHRRMTRRPFGRADRLFRDEAMSLLEAVGLAGFAELPAGQLSHGDQRAIEIAISLALGSKLVLLDEPTAGMSAFETQKAMDLVRRVATEKNLTLLFCEHDMEVVFGTARTVTVMHMGRVLTEGTPEQVRRDADVQKVYLGELETEETGVTA
jgi:ABC-type branched-subunit amino acid transport system ATPase component/ABC-type branched-subunit amino acid transport system permease subunit